MSAWRIEKVADEGSSSPYYARLWAGIPELRDAVLNARVDPRQLEAARYQFDEQYEPVLRSLDSTRNATKKIGEILKEHRQKLETGVIVRFQRNAFEISESIADLLRDHVAQFLNNAVRALKGSQEVVKYFGVEIGCLFTRDQNFAQGIAAIRTTEQSSLADFLSETRSKWSANLIQRRHDLEHKGWVLPKTDYRVTNDGKIEMHEPKVGGQVVSAYTREMFNRVTSFVENVVVYSFQVAVKPELGIEEIPKDRRPTFFPKRFALWHPIMGTPEWNLTYSEDDFL